MGMKWSCPAEQQFKFGKGLQWFLLPEENTECFCTEWPSPVLQHTYLPAWGTRRGADPQELCAQRPLCGRGLSCVSREWQTVQAHRGAVPTPPTAQPSHAAFRAGAIYGAGSKHGERDCLNAWSLNRQHFLGSYALHFPGERHTLTNSALVTSEKQKRMKL